MVARAALAAGGVLVVVVCAAVGGLAQTATSSAACGPAAPATELARTTIPSNLMPLYRAAQQKYGVPWNVLAAINKIETGFGANLNVSSAGAQGWMQFMPATWAAYGVDGNGDGEKNPDDPEDAIPAAANYLKASGAPEDLRRAIFAYNHADWYVRDVLEWAHRFAADPALGDPVAGVSCESGAPVDGAPKRIIDTVVLPIARSCAVPRTVAENDAANARHGPTTSGSRSDHQGPPDQAWAADMSNGFAPTPEMDCLADRLAERFGIPWTGSGLVDRTDNGYRFQLIWRAADHYNHVHFGVRRVAAPAV